MKLVQELHQAHFFTNNADVTATPPIVAALMQAIGRFNLIPNMGDELNAITGERRKIPMMVSPDESLRVEFPINEIVIIGAGGSLKDFTEKANDIFKELASVFPEKKGNRLSLLNNKFYEGETSEYEELYKKIFTYHDGNPFEWDNRIVERKILPSKEAINSITTIRRCQISSPSIQSNKLINSVIFELDSNTVRENPVMRFSLLDSNKVIGELLANNQDVSNELRRYTEQADE